MLFKRIFSLANTSRRMDLAQQVKESLSRPSQETRADAAVCRRSVLLLDPPRRCGLLSVFLPYSNALLVILQNLIAKLTNRLLDCLLVCLHTYDEKNNNDKNKYFPTTRCSCCCCCCKQGEELDKAARAALLFFRVRPKRSKNKCDRRRDKTT